MGKLHINLLGTSFTVQASEDDTYLDQLLGYYERIIEDVSKVASVKTPLQKSILAGIMLCDELYKTKTNLASVQSGQKISLENNYDNIEMEQRAQKMIDSINKVL